ncbi:MAG: hypothetical protein LUC43_06710, partial [Burkholderiales bacterium]|nr:hypothetical protein [Burkholderiales bacterium]
GLAKWFDFIWSGFWPEDEAAIAQEAQAQEFFGEEAFLYSRDVDIYQQFLVEMTELKDLLAKVKQLLEARVEKNSIAVQRLLEEINGFQAV